MTATANGDTTYTYIIERCRETSTYVGHIPGIIGAHSVGDTLEELHANMKDVIELLREGGHLTIDSDFVGTEQLEVVADAASAAA
jgi:predicted RNase H-like HicB family nuclease